MFEYLKYLMQQILRKIWKLIQAFNNKKHRDLFILQK